jgi:type I restriction enzyme S subunit
LDSGSAQSQITIDDLKRLEVSLPSLLEQQRVVRVLKSFDDRIVLNNRINHNLEEQADCLISAAIETQSIGSAHLWDICSYVTERVNCDTLNNVNYISTDNMFANRGGVGIALTIPGGKCTSFKVQDVLVSNIRPYFKKIWRASFSGGCSNDVLCFRTTTGSSSFLYHLLRSDVFFEYVMSLREGMVNPIVYIVFFSIQEDIFVK